MMDDPREDMLQRFNGLVYKYAHRYAHTPDFAEDLVQEAKIGLLKKDPEKLESVNYAISTIVGSMIDYVRSQTHRGKLCTSQLTDEYDISDNFSWSDIDNDILISDVAQVLTHRQREVIDSRLSGQDSGEISAKIGVSTVRVWQIEKDAIRKMKRLVI
jgi:RNA polymerase sigma factor (sigma-70 family)